VSPPKNNWM